MDRYQQLRQFISDFVDGPNAEAFLQSVADQLQEQDDLTVAVTDQLTICTASGVYLDQLLAAKGITRPGDLGMSDFSYAALGIGINQAKLITQAIHNVLSIFYGDDYVRASTMCTQPGPWSFKPGDDLQIVLENGVVNTLVITGSEFVDISQATADEVSNLITNYLYELGYFGYAQTYTDPTNGDQYVQVFGGARGPYSLVEIVGGAMQDQMEFPTIRATNLPSNTTVWQITRNIADTYRFTWVSGPQPLLSNVFPGDSVMIYGPQFQEAGFYGTFIVSAASPAQPTPAADSGYFEIQSTIPTAVLASILPNTVPPANDPPLYYSITVTQALYSDLKFFLPNKNTPYDQRRYALCWEPDSSTVKIYMPATTQVVERSLIGSAHIHDLYPPGELNGSFGSVSDPAQQIIVINPYAIKYAQSGYNTMGTGGTLTYGSTTVDIEYVSRSEFFTTVLCTEPHGITGSTDQYGVTRSTTIVNVNVGLYLTDNQQIPFLGPYMLDPTVSYTLTSNIVTLREPIVGGQNVSTLLVNGQLPNASGQLLFALNQDNEESPVPYVAAQTATSAESVPIQSISQNGFTVTVTTTSPANVVVGQSVSISGTVNFNGVYTVASISGELIYTFQYASSRVLFESTGESTPVVVGAVTTLILDSAYTFKYNHAIGDNIYLLSATQAYTPNPTGTDYGFYVTGVANGTVFAQQIIQAITAAGINLDIIILYPNDEGLGNAGDSTLPGVSPQSDATYVWGGDPTV
jgi:hypothetical protein